MQVAGEECSKCGKSIGFAIDGIGCVRCASAYHRACIDDGKICPTCREDLSSQAEIIASETACATDETIKTGRLHFITAASAMFIIMWLPLLLRSLAGFDLDVPDVQVFTKLITMGILLAAYLGQTWARVILSVQTLLGVGFSVFVIIPALLSGERSSFIVDIILVFLMFYMFYVFAFSKQVSFFLEDQRSQ